MRKKGNSFGSSGTTQSDITQNDISVFRLNSDSWTNQTKFLFQSVILGIQEHLIVFNMNLLEQYDPCVEMYDTVLDY